MDSSASYRPWSLRRLVGNLAGGHLPVEQPLELAGRRIAETEDSVQAWAQRFAVPDPAVPGPLAGVPLGVKDIIDVAGVPSRCGSPLRADAAPALNDASIVARWRALGMVPVGKTVTTEFAYFAPGPTRNPIAPWHTPGGSSSGSAAAVAAGHVPLALSSQTAGSTIRPASFCGIAGLVLTRGLVPTDGIAALSGSLDRHGMHGAGVGDLALAFSLLTGDDDAGAAPSSAPRLWCWNGDPLDAVEPVMADAFAVAVRRLRDAGATVERFPAEALLDEATTDHQVVFAYEAARERAEEHRQADQLSDPLRALLDAGAAIPHDHYMAAVERIAAGASEIAGPLTSYDAILAPGAPGPAPHGRAATGDPAMSRAGQALGLTALAVPGLRTADTGLPLGLQLLGAPHEETRLLRAGCWVERHITPTTA